METTSEFLRSLGVSISRTGRRLWPDAVKARAVAETLLPGATVNDVAAKYGVRANHVSEWRRLARDGHLVLPAPSAEAEFAALVLCDAEVALPIDRTARQSSPIEVVTGSVTIKLDTSTPAGRIAEIVRALGEGA
jgi:transposase